MISKPEATDVAVEHALVDVVHHNLVTDDVGGSLGLVDEFGGWVARDRADGWLG